MGTAPHVPLSSCIQISYNELTKEEKVQIAHHVYSYTVDAIRKGIPSWASQIITNDLVYVVIDEIESGEPVSTQAVLVPKERNGFVYFEELKPRQRHGLMPESCQFYNDGECRTNNPRGAPCGNSICCWKCESVGGCSWRCTSCP